MIGDRVCESAGTDTGSRMDDHAGRFVDDGEVFVFEDDVERDVLGFKSGSGFFGKVDIDLVAFVDPIRRFRGLAVHENRLILDQSLQARAGPSFDACCNKCIKSRTCFFGGCDDG